MVVQVNKYKVMNKILFSFDGGGMNGYHSICIAEEIEKRTGKQFCEFTYAIAGTSIGAINASMLGLGINATDIKDFYKQYKDIIFNKQWWRICPKYSSNGIEKVLDTVFQDDYLGLSKIPILIPAYNLTQNKAHFFKSYDEYTKLFKYKDILRATSSGQTYFPWCTINNEVFLDGGNIANNPSSCLFNDFNDSDYLISIGTGCSSIVDKGVITRINCGYLGNLKATLDAFLVGGESNVDYEMSIRLKGAYMRLNPTLKYSTSILGASNKEFKLRIENGNHAIKQFNSEINNIVKLINQI